MSRGAYIKRLLDEGMLIKAPPMTVDDVMRVHAQFGPLDRNSVKQAMAENWPVEWDAISAGEGIFADANQEAK